MEIGKLWGDSSYEYKWKGNEIYPEGIGAQEQAILPDADSR
jgi:hypothetical protein